MFYDKIYPPTYYYESFSKKTAFMYGRDDELGFYLVRSKNAKLALPLIYLYSLYLFDKFCVR